MLSRVFGCTVVECERPTSTNVMQVGVEAFVAGECLSYVEIHFSMPSCYELPCPLAEFRKLPSALAFFDGTVLDGGHLTVSACHSKGCASLDSQYSFPICTAYDRNSNGGSNCQW